MPATEAPTPLWRTLGAVARCVHGVLQGQSSRSLLARHGAGQRAAVQALLFDALRHLGRAQALQQSLAPHAPPPAVAALLCTALALACQDAPPYPPHTLVSQAVEAARQGGLHAHAGFINACLRRFLRERATLLAACETWVQARFNHPHWWVERLRQDHPQHWQPILHASNRHAPMTLRVNLAKNSRPHYQQALLAAGMPADAVGAAGLQLHQPQPVQALPGFAQGLASVQDAAAQLAAPLLLQGLAQEAGQTRRPLRVLDACAAPGGKTGHLLEYAAAYGMALQVTALEMDAQRAAHITQTLQRLGFAAQADAQVLVADARDPAQWFAPACAAQPFDAILLDAPCTASGISARQPDIRWLRRPGDVVQLAQTQARLLDSLWPLLAPAGRLLYCTCSVFHAEGQAQAQAFAARHPQAQPLPAPGHLLPRSDSAPGGHALGAHDGFFYAMWYKKCQNLS